ncbi:unnamed protein product [Rotaria socialis]|uniref:Uncharacterized protein n=1 Tax=Rotaria socialis TaxID=392032 RepID=A0A818QMA3_9BILA|nr:unnamed protein product [Rotaria socialis]CAF3642665.1 unnamed protein product [Rotaria socialis]
MSGAYSHQRIKLFNCLHSKINKPNGAFKICYSTSDSHPSIWTTDNTHCMNAGIRWLKNMPFNLYLFLDMLYME